MLEKAFSLMPKRDIYENTGIQFMQLNTVFQFLAARLQRPELFKKADKMIFIADLVSYYLCGEVFAEYTLASTSQMMDMKTGKWSKSIFEKLSLPLDIMPKIVEPGTVVGKLKKELAAKFGCEQIPVIAIGSHDTASAVAAVPTKGNNWAYLSSGTWSLMGVEIPKAIINDTTFKYSFTNEGGIENTIRLLKNIMGLWLVQQSRQQWLNEGTELNYAQIAQMAENAKPFAGYISPNDSRFLPPGDMPSRINDYLKETNQTTTNDKGQIIRIILESLAFNYRWVLERIEEIISKKIDVLHIVGGGIQNELLCQFTADALGRKVVTGPIEATASGNIIMQAIAAGQIDSLRKARDIVAASFEVKEYMPSDTKPWQKQYEKVKHIFQG